VFGMTVSIAIARESVKLFKGHYTSISNPSMEYVKKKGERTSDGI
jgi:hypothetical protein